MKPRVIRHVPFTPGEVSTSDLCYPVGNSRSYPRIALTDCRSRFTAASFLNNKTRENSVSHFLQTILADSGANYEGKLGIWHLRLTE